jgi:hypothetical protein
MPRSSPDGYCVQDVAAADRARDAAPTVGGEAHSAPFLKAMVISASTKPGLMVSTRTPLLYSR